MDGSSLFLASVNNRLWKQLIHFYLQVLLTQFRHQGFEEKENEGSWNVEYEEDPNLIQKHLMNKTNNFFES